MIYTIRLNIPDLQAQDFFAALQPSYPIEEGELPDAYMNRVAVAVLKDLTQDYFIKKAQQEAVANIVYPGIQVVQGE